MRPMRTGLALLACLTVLATDAAAQRRHLPATIGEMLAQPCFACHGPMGASGTAPMPIIGGQKEAYLNATLLAFKDSTRPATVMTRLMKGYSDAEIAAMARYLSQQDFVGARQKFDAAVVEKGRQGYNRACKRCHLEGGRESSDADYPILAGQWLPYMQSSMGEILNGTRIVDEKFRSSLEKLTREEVDAILHFYAAQY